MSGYLQLDDRHPHIKTVGDLLNSVYQRDVIFKNNFLGGVVSILVILALVVFFMYKVDKHAGDDIKAIIGWENLSIGAIIISSLIAAIPWIHAFMTHKLTMDKWSRDKNIWT